MNTDFNSFREKIPFFVWDQANRHLIETKLVDILEDLKLENRDQIFLVEYITEGKLTLLGVSRNEDQETILKTLSRRFKKMPKNGEEEGTKENEDQTNWTVTPYDLGGHTSYFNSQKLFTCGSSVFFLAFQR